MAGFFDKLCRRLLPGSDRHIADQAMAELFSGDTSFPKRLIALRHFSSCSYCRLRRETLQGQRAERMIELYGATIESEPVSSHQKSRAEFAAWLEMQLLLEKSPAQRTTHRFAPLALRLQGNIPALSIGLALGLFAGAAGLHLWWLHHIPHITANALLVRAEKSETASTSSTPAVAYQAIQIKTPRGTEKRSLYRDLQARRKPKAASVGNDEARLREEELRATLDEAGVDWNQPLSAASYQAWHDRLHERSDRIAFAEHDLLTLTTSVPGGDIASETLTVREADFHPVRRDIDFRHQGTIEIAEVDFRVLPWSAVDSNAFEPVLEMPRTAALALPAGSATLQPLPSEERLDETELTARLVLNQLHADSGEQIAIHRTAREVEVAGFVDSDERKQELRSELAVVPGLKISIRSPGDTKKEAVSESSSAQMLTASLPDSPSALEQYEKARGRNTEEVNAAASQLLREALVISRESQALVELGSRFPQRSARPAIVSASVTDLLYSHRERLKAAIREQRLLLFRSEEAQLKREPQTQDVTVADEALLKARAERNLALVKELTQTDTPSSRNAEAIFQDLNATLDSLNAAAGELYARYQQPPAANGRD